MNAVPVVDTPHYRGAFQFDEAADIAKFQSPESYPFDPNAFPEYELTMTHQSGSALDEPSLNAKASNIAGRQYNIPSFIDAETEAALIQTMDDPRVRLVKGRGA